MSAAVILLKSNIWQRERMVGIILCFSVVASMKMACDGGSSSVFKKALNAEVVSMCTSSMMYTLYFPAWGANLTWSIKSLISSTELLLAASSSCTLKDWPLLNEMHDLHLSQASPSEEMDSQLMVLASILAQVVFPTPLGPVNKNAWARWLLMMAFFNVVVMWDCPTTVANV